MAYGWVNMAKYRRQFAPRGARRLKNLQIDEVSVVDRGAGRGVDVLLMKRASAEQERETNMQNIFKGGAVSYMNVAKRAVEAAAAGEISEHAFGKVQRDLAASMFPLAKSEGAALAAFFETSVGKATLAQRPRISAARNIELLKAEGRYPHGGDDGEQDDGDATPRAGADNPFHAALSALADKLRQQPEHRTKTKEQAYDHLLTHGGPAAKQMFQLATHYDLMRPA